jgi:hypothetical protein
MKASEFFRLNNIPESTGRRVIREAAKPADVGVVEGGTSHRPSYTVADPELLFEAVVRRGGSGAIPPPSLIRMHALLCLAIEADLIPSGATPAMLSKDAKLIRVLLPHNRAA